MNRIIINTVKSRQPVVANVQRHHLRHSQLLGAAQRAWKLRPVSLVPDAKTSRWVLWRRRSWGAAKLSLGCSSNSKSDIVLESLLRCSLWMLLHETSYCVLAAHCGQLRRAWSLVLDW